MTRKHLSVLLALSMAANLTAPAAGQATGETYFFRYKTTMASAEVPSEGQSKDIVAFFVGGIGIAFDERLPLKPEWEDDDWVIKKGALPDGITFDAATRSFKGTPTAAVTNREVELEGFDKTGASVATALATFDVYTIQGAPFPVDIYAHTGKYKLDQLPLPAKTIETWTRVYSPPAGIQIIGRNLDGTPTKAGIYPVFLQGKDYLGNVVATYFGKYTVEDGPSFALIPDSVQKLPQLEYSSGLGPYDFGAPVTFPVNRAINPAKKVRYFAEIKEGDDLPYGISLDDNPLDLRFRGMIARPYDTVTVRFKALDSDDTIGFSNWFTFGSSDPQPGCYPTPIGVLTTYTGTPSSIGVPRPAGAQGKLQYILASGTLPEGLKLEEDTGLITGTPVKAEAVRSITVDINVINESGTVKAPSCVYSVESQNGTLSVVDSTPTQARHIRVGAAYAGGATVRGGIKDFTTALAAAKSIDGISIVGDTRNATSVALEGTVASKGLPHTVGLTVSNGDGNKKDGFVSVYAHDQLAFGAVGDIQAQRMAAAAVLGDVPYDASTVINDYSGAVDYPLITLDHPERLPTGIAFDGRSFTGSTSEPAGTYGPFQATMTDFTGQTTRSAAFSLNVSARQDISVSAVVPPVFVIRRQSSQSLAPVTVAQPAGAANLKVTWTVNGAMPGWLSFNGDTGDFTAAADLPFSAIGPHGPFTVTAVDSDGSTVTSDEFDVLIVDLPPPATSPVATTTGNVSGDGSKGETPTFVHTPSIRASIQASTIVGGVDKVTFGSIDPENPAGLDFNPVDGSFSGEPTSEFTGNVSVAFKDTDGREGVAQVPLEIKPYPQVAMTQDAFDLTRLADAGFIVGKAVSGFWGTPVWSLASGVLPDGVTVAASGALTGNTTAADNTVFPQIVLKARDSATGLTTVTQPFSVTVKPKGDFTVTYSGTDTFMLDGKTATTDYVVATHDAVAPSLTGSSNPPMTYSIVSSEPDLPDGLSINRDTGVAAFTGTPVLGRWNLKVAARDSDGQSAKSQADLAIWSTLAGNINQPDQANAPGAGDDNGLGDGNNYVLRVGEPFMTKAIKASNYVGDITFSTSPAMLDSGLDFSGANGAFSDDSHFQNPGTFDISVTATDSDNRTMPPITFGFQVVAPLDLKTIQSNFSAAQFANGSLDAQFQPATNGLGKIAYAVTGDAPGTLTYALYNDQNLLTSYQWQDSDGNAYELAVDPVGQVTGLKIDGAPQATPSETAPDYFAPDALVFDPHDLTLKGTPSKTGTFSMKLVATDDHANHYIKDVDTRVQNNQAEAPFTITSSASAPLDIANTTKDGLGDTETINLYTSLPTLATTVSNAAYGKPVTWTQVAGTLPAGVSASKGAQSLGYSGYPSATGTYSDIRWRAKDAAGRTIDSSPASLTVAARLPLALVASSNPAGVIVNADHADITVTAKNAAYGQTNGWTVTGVENLPPGMNYTVGSDKVWFWGKATVIGTYSNVRVSVTDGVGASATIDLTFKVISPTDAITLAVSNLTTKAGYPFSIPAAAGNTYGAVRFYSNDIDTKYAQSLKIGSTSGLIEGQFATTQQANFDVYVTDETNRVTSRPVIVDVIPVLRIAVPTLVTLTQGSSVAQMIDAFNVLGSARFEKIGQWPAGIDLDPANGKISISNAATGTYDNLQVRGTDTFSGNQVDTQLSNAFSIKVDPIDALPRIDAVANNKLAVGTVGTAFTAFTPVVRDDKANNPWPGPLIFAINHDIAADAGLAFDTKTGTISGTPTKPIIYKDLVITATTERGDKTSTQPFWLGVQPPGPITADPVQQTHFVIRLDTDMSIGPFKFFNTYGTLSWSGTPTATDPNTGVLAAKAPLPAIWYTGPNGKWTNNFVTVTDEFGRKGTIEYTVTDVYGLVITPPTLKYNLGDPAITSAAPVVANVYGAASFTANGLPSWLTLNANGSVTGAAPTGTPVGTYSFSVTLTDSFDRASKTATYSFDVTDIKAYRVLIDAAVAHPSLAYCVGMAEFRVFSGSTNVTALSSVAVPRADSDYPASSLTDGGLTIASTWFTTVAGETWVSFDVVPGKLPTSISWATRGDGLWPCNPTSWRIQATSDNQNWNTVGNGSSSGTPSTDVKTLIP
ncbi:hypothetical protein HFN89_06825 [Rhizobium laguerreae]|nr:hypothetical protein [Rhizobium laguerreae]